MPRGAAKARAMQRQARTRRRIQHDLRMAVPAEVKPGLEQIQDRTGKDKPAGS